MKLTYIPLSRSSRQIIAFDKMAPLVNALVLSNLCEYCHRSYISKKTDSLDYILFAAGSVDISPTTLS